MLKLKINITDEIRGMFIEQLRGTKNCENLKIRRKQLIKLLQRVEDFSGQSALRELVLLEIKKTDDNKAVIWKIQKKVG